MDESFLEGKGKFFYPSVDCGPINNLKAKSILNFQPSSIEEAIQKTVDFYLNAEEYTVEFKKVNNKLKKVFKIK